MIREWKFGRDSVGLNGQETRSRSHATPARHGTARHACTHVSFAREKLQLQVSSVSKSFSVLTRLGGSRNCISLQASSADGTQSHILFTITLINEKSISGCGSRAGWLRAN